MQKCRKMISLRPAHGGIAGVQQVLLVDSELHAAAYAGGGIRRNHVELHKVRQA